MDQRNGFSGVLLVLAAGVLWGTVGPAQVLADSPAPPVTLGAARILSGGLLLALFVLMTEPRAVRGLGGTARLPLLAAAAATGTFQAAFLTAVDRTGAAVATAIVFGLVPVSTGVCERLVLRTRLSRRWAAGTACAVGGCALLMVPGFTGALDPVGLALALVGGCCFGVYTVSAKILGERGVNMAAAVAVTLLAGGALLLPWALRGAPELAVGRSPALVAWLGPATTAVAYMCFVIGLRRVTAATAGTLSLAEPLVAAVLALAVLGERLSAATTAGCLLLLGGLVLVSVPGRIRPPRRTRRDAPLCLPDATGAVKVESTTGERS
ncbi:DMT family transporter [Spirillospora sp. NPDC029432]|uniref:DMT family transporter n=1 Tax=Spirillospora sp. NPDC029432 TaxID=3154599 RepID=UPI003451B9F8